MHHLYSAATSRNILKCMGHMPCPAYYKVICMAYGHNPTYTDCMGELSDFLWVRKARSGQFRWQFAVGGRYTFNYCLTYTTYSIMLFSYYVLFKYLFFNSAFVTKIMHI